MFSQVNKCRPLANIVFAVRPELAGGRGSDWWLWQRHAQTFIPGHRWTGSGTHPSLSQIPLPDIIEILLVRYPSLLVLHNAHVYRPHINIQYVGNVNNYVIVHTYTYITLYMDFFNLWHNIWQKLIFKNFNSQWLYICTVWLYICTVWLYICTVWLYICTVWLRSKFYRAGHAAML